MSHSQTPIVYILDPDAALREALGRLLGSVGLTVQTFAGLEPFLTDYDPQRPACLLLDLRLPDGGADGVQDRLRIREIDLPVIVIAQRSDVAAAVTVMKRGAKDFLQKPLNEQVLLDVVHDAIAEDQGRRRIRAWRQEILGRFATLTPREQDIFQPVAAGLSNRDIAGRLELSHKTVEVHRAKVMQKMGARTLSQLIQMAMAMGMLQRYDQGE